MGREQMSCGEMATVFMSVGAGQHKTNTQQLLTDSTLH
jgi:hypothetical protein